MADKPDVYVENFEVSTSSPIICTVQYNNALKPELIDVLHTNNVRPIILVSADQIISKELLEKFDSNEIVLDLSVVKDFTQNNLTEWINNFNINYKMNLTTILVDKDYLDLKDLNSIKQNEIENVLYTKQTFGLPKLIGDNILTIPFTKNSETLYSRNCLNFLYYNPKFNCKTNPEDEFVEEVNQLKINKYNFISLNSLKNWWEARDKITSQISLISENEIEILISNKNSVEVNNLKVYLNINNKIDKKSLIISFKDSPLDYHFDEITGIVEMMLDSIRPNSVNKIKLSFDVE
jgi:hypothetical protein